MTPPPALSIESEIIDSLPPPEPSNIGFIGFPYKYLDSISLQDMSSA